MGVDQPSARNEQSWCREAPQLHEAIPRRTGSRQRESRWARFEGLGPYLVYTFRNHDGEVLYVGATKNLANRMSGRGVVDSWFLRVCHWLTEVEPFSDVESAADREQQLIFELDPAHNLSGRNGSTYIRYHANKGHSPREAPQRSDKYGTASLKGVTDFLIADASAQLSEVEQEVERLRVLRDQQILQACALPGVTWRRLQAITGLSPRGLQMALERARSAATR